MLTITYDEVKTLAADLAGRVPDKFPPSEAKLARHYASRHLPRVHRREAWEESCLAFVTVTLTAGQFAKNEATQGALLSLYALGNPQLTTIVERLDDWTEGDGLVRVTTRTAGPLYAEFQTPPATLPEYGDANLAATTLAERYLYPLACLIAADLIRKRDPTEYAFLHREAEQELLEQASRIKRPWWRR